MPHPPEPTELERQVRKLRLETRKLRVTVIFSAIAICLAMALGGTFGYPVVLVIMGALALAFILLLCIAGSARLVADAWDAVAMRWQRARWQAERNKPDERD